MPFDTSHINRETDVKNSTNDGIVLEMKELKQVRAES